MLVRDSCLQVLADLEYRWKNPGVSPADVLLRARSQRNGVQAICAAIFDVRNCVCQPEVCSRVSRPSGSAIWPANCTP